VHGLLGWGPGELGGLRHWGDATAQFDPRFAVHESKCGPLSSFHDRACELFAQIDGSRVDYGEAHSAAAGHRRFGRAYERAFVPDWSAENPVVLVAHSAGAHTCLRLQTLLAEDFWGLGTSADWIEAVVSVAGVYNGSLLSYMFCDEKTGRLRDSASTLIGKALGLVERVTRIAADRAIDLMLDAWATEPAEDFWAFLRQIDASAFVADEDNLAYDLTLQGCRAANRAFTTSPGTRYLSLTTSATREASAFDLPFLPRKQRLDRALDAIRIPGALYQLNRPDFAAPPIPEWGAGDFVIGAWRDNDGAVSAVSQRLPYAHPFGGEGIFGRERIEPGQWHVERIETAVGCRFTHIDPIFGGLQGDAALRDSHRLLYRKLNETLLRL
jgi:triacylglycerol lipase